MEFPDWIQVKEKTLQMYFLEYVTEIDIVKYLTVVGSLRILTQFQFTCSTIHVIYLFPTLNLKFKRSICNFSGLTFDNYGMYM